MTQFTCFRVHLLSPTARGAIKPTITVRGAIRKQRIELEEKKATMPEIYIEGAWV